MTLKKRIEQTFFFAGLLFCLLFAPVKTMAQNLNFEQLRSLALQAGFEPDVAPTMAAISLAESGGNPNAHNPVYPDNSYGLTQVNMIDIEEEGYLLGAERRARYGLDSNEQLKDPLTNMRVAKDIYDQQGLNAWSVYKNKRYLDFLPESEMPGTNYNEKTISSGSTPVSNTGSSNRDEAKPVGPNEAAVIEALGQLGSFVQNLVSRSVPSSSKQDVMEQFDFGTTREEQMRGEEQRTNQAYQQMLSGNLGQDRIKNALTNALSSLRF